MKNRDGQIAIDLVQDKKTIEIFEKYAMNSPYNNLYNNNNQFHPYHDKLTIEQHQYERYRQGQMKVDDGGQQDYYISELNNEHFQDPNQMIKQNNQHNFPHSTELGSIQNQIIQYFNTNQQLDDSRVLNQYEILIHQANQDNFGTDNLQLKTFPDQQDEKPTFNKPGSIQQNQDNEFKIEDEIQNNFTFKNLFDNSMENYNQEEIEEQRFDQFNIKESHYIHSPRFQNNSTKQYSQNNQKIKHVPQLNQLVINQPNEIQNNLNLNNNHNTQYLEQNYNNKQNVPLKNNFKDQKNQDLTISVNPNNVNEFMTKSDIVSNKMYINEHCDIDFNDYKSPQLIHQSQSQHQQINSQYQLQLSSKGSNINTVAVSNENQIAEPHIYSPRKHKYYLYFKSLKNRLIQDKQQIGNDIEQGIENQYASNKQLQGIISPNESEQGFTEIGQTFKELQTIIKLNSNKKIQYQDKSQLKSKNLIDFIQGFQSLSQLNTFQLANQNEDFDESNIIIDDTNTNDFMKIQDSLQIKRISVQNSNENEYFQKKQQIKEYLQNNQSIPFKLNNIYNTPCDPKKDLDFKMLSNTDQNQLTQTNNQNNQEKQINKNNQETILYSKAEIQGPETYDSEYNQNDQQIINNEKDINQEDNKQRNNNNQNSNENTLLIQNNQLEQNQLQIQSSPISRKNSINCQLSNNKKKILLSPTPSTNSIFFVNRQIISIHQLVIDENVLDSNLFYKNDNDYNQNGFQNQPLELNIGIKKKRSSSIHQQLGSIQQMPTFGKTEGDQNHMNQITTNKKKFGFEFTQNILEIGISLFNSEPLYGLSFLMLFDYVKLDSEEIVKFLMQNPSSFLPQQASSFESNYLLKKSKQAITQILTDLSIQENSEILYYFSTFFNFSNSSFCSALRYFVQELQLQNDPEQIDILLSFFAKKFYRQNQQQSTLFESADSVHMLAFATFMLDIDIHFHNDPNLPKLIKEFQMNISGINDGKNFSQDFINNIIQNLIDKKMAHIVSSKLIEKQKQHYLAVFNLLLHEKSQIFVQVFKHSSKIDQQKIFMKDNQNQKNQQEYMLFILDNIAIVTNKTHTHNTLQHIYVFSMLSLVINFKNQILTLKPAQIFNKNSIQVAKLNQQTKGFFVKQKQQISFRVQGDEEAKILDQKLRLLFSSQNPTQQQKKI